MIGCQALSREATMKTLATVISLLLILAASAMGCGGAADNSIGWNTDQVSFEAEDFWILAYGTTFYSTEDALITSEVRGDTYCLLEASWTENGVPMLVRIEFRANASIWWMDSLWSYDGSQKGKLKRYACPCSFKEELGHARRGDIQIDCAHGCYETCGTRIHFDNLRVEPFLNAE
jgi:hypothetical protein